MKKTVFLFVSLLFCLALLSSCVLNEALFYEDRFDELDIAGRFNDLAYHIEHGETNAILYKQANTIIEDLESIRITGNETLEKINNDFIAVAHTLIEAMDHLKADDLLAFSSCYYAAKDLYNETDKSLNRYKKIDWSTTSNDN